MNRPDAGGWGDEVLDEGAAWLVSTGRTRSWGLASNLDPDKLIGETEEVAIFLC